MTTTKTYFAGGMPFVARPRAIPPMPQLYSTSLLDLAVAAKVRAVDQTEAYQLGAGVTRLVADLDAANQHRQELVGLLDAAETQVVELAEEVILLRKDLGDARLQLALERTARAVTGRSYAEVSAELDVRVSEPAETFDEIWDDDDTVVVDVEEPAVRP